MKRKDKEVLIADMHEVFEQAGVGLLLQTMGMNVEETTVLRKGMEKSDIKVRVLQNRLSKRAIEHTPFEGFKEHLKEQRTLAYGQDPVSAAKCFFNFAKDNKEKIALIAAVLVTNGVGRMLSAAEVKDFSQLPSREELLAQLLGLMKAPQTQLVKALNDAPARLVRVLAAIGKQKSDETFDATD